MSARGTHLIGRLGAHRGVMARLLPYATLTVIAVAAVGCQEISAPAPQRSPISDVAVGQAAPAPYGGAHLIWDDVVSVGPAGIRGDGRNRFGQEAAPLNQYQRDHCGVRAFLYDRSNTNGNLDFDPDTYYDAATMSGPCGAARSLTFYLDGSTATATGPHFLVSIWHLLPGEVRIVMATFGGVGGCAKVLFDAAYPGASGVRTTRLPDFGGARQWRVESQGNHQAACVTLHPKSGKAVDTSIRYYLPFATTVTHIPYPGSSYP